MISARLLLLFHLFHKTGTAQFCFPVTFFPMFFPPRYFVSPRFIFQKFIVFFQTLQFFPGKYISFPENTFVAFQLSNRYDLSHGV
jgi:hypothetical protein